jgi:hypothetical protein
VVVEAIDRQAPRGLMEPSRGRLLGGVAGAIDRQAPGEVKSSWQTSELVVGALTGRPQMWWVEPSIGRLQVMVLEPSIGRLQVVLLEPS